MHENTIGIKICGITRPEDIDILNYFEVDYAGFVFTESKRRISFEKAAELADILKPSIIKVGVFTEINVPKVNEMYQAGIINIVQVHGNNYGLYRGIEAPIWVSVSINDRSISCKSEEIWFAEGIHLDTYDKKLAGGTGRTFNWELVSAYKTKKKLILSGGLNYRNVSDALAVIKADVVDVSSGVETIIDGNRKKDRDLVGKFIEGVRNYEKQR